MECSTLGCIRAVFARGLCRHHYDDDRKAAAPKCGGPACERPAVKRGLCEPHYRRQLAKVSAPCSIIGCARPVVSAGLCDAHRKRKARHGHVEPTRPADWGGRRGHPLFQTWNWHKRHQHRGNLCDEWAEDFWRFVAEVGARPGPDAKLRRKDGSAPLGPTNFAWEFPATIAATTDKKTYYRDAQRQFRARHPEKVRAYKFKAAYGITIEQFRQMAEAQGGVCAICGEAEVALSRTTLEPRELSVDHCHKSGKVRALLCAACNGGLGNFRDDPALLEKAIAYLRKHTLLAPS